MIKEASEGQRQKAIKKLGAAYLMKKSRCTSTNRITFEKVFQEVLHRKDNDFYCIDSPQLNQQLQNIQGYLPDKYRTALSTPSSATVTALERKRYINIKGRIQKVMETLDKKKLNNLKDTFMEKQAILTDFLNELANEMERECREKADILKYLWNSMVQLLENVAEKLTQKIKHREKNDVEQSLKSHQQYQQLIDGYRQKQVQLSEKSHVQRMTIDSLIYELRFKRKQINKLYRNQKLLVNKLNDFKIENLNMQNNYLDLLSSQEKAESQSKVILQAKDQVRRNMYSKFAVAGSKRQNKKEISEQLELRATKIQDLQNLYDEIKLIAGTKLGSPHLVSSLIEASIDNFGLKYDDKFTTQSKILSVPQKIIRLNAQTQTISIFPKGNHQQKHCASTQYGYYDKLTQQLINNKGTQSYFQYPKKVQTNAYQTQVNKLQLLSYGKARENNITRTIDQIIFGVKQFKPHNFIKVSGGISPKNHKKNYSDLQINASFPREFPQNTFIQDYIQQIEYQKSDSQMTQQFQIKKKKPLKRNSIKFIKQSNSMNISPALSKQRYSLTSKQAFNRFNEDDTKPKKSNFAPLQLSGEQSPQINGNALNRISSGSKPERISRDTTKKSATQKFQKSNERDQFAKNGFYQKNNYFNIEIDAEKQAAILKMFLNKDYSTVGVDDIQDLIDQSDQDVLAHQKTNPQLQTLLSKQQAENVGFKRSTKRKQTNLSSLQSKSKYKRYSDTTSKYKDQNDMILNLCRSNYQKKHKKIKQKIRIFKYQDEFTSVKDKIQFIARDVNDLVMNKENMLKKTINSKNIKSTYKILMMTFSKAYDAYNKGILRGNLIYPLFQSFALVYGAINNNQIYKKMINFVAALCVNKENTILRFFLFFLGLDSSSKYSEKVTISEVYLCLKLLQKISVDGKVTLNIESIYTDTTKIKEQLMSILKQQNIPQLLSQSIQKRVTQQLQNSSLYQNSTSQSHLKLNIYNIILLIIQQVIKCKNTLKQTLIPILMKYQIYQKEKKLPVSLIEVILFGWRSPNYDPNKLKALVQIITNNGKRETATIQQFCSILFESNLVNIDQLFFKSDFLFRKNWKIPLAYLQEVQYKMINKKYDTEIQKREIQLFFQISSHNNRGQFIQQNPTIQKMKRIIFERHYERKISQLSESILGELQICCN